MSTFSVDKGFEPRSTTFDGVLDHDGWRLKLYSVCQGGRDLDEARFAVGQEMALAALPRPAQTNERPGVGLLIRHQANALNYAVLCWWDRENEFPIRVFVDDGEGWRPARGGESVCVWDLEVIWTERNAYVDKVLAKTGVPDLLAYLETHAGVVG